ERERYALYELEKRALVTHAARRKVERVRLCVVLASEDASMPLADVAEAALEGGAGMLRSRARSEGSRRPAARYPS
ncbi:MAG: hypothetical protein ACYSU0_19450, partial [Planctomycetota bacterium]